MLLGKPWLKDAKLAHDWGNNMIMIQRNGIVGTIIVIKHLGTNLKRPKFLLCFDYENGIINEEEDLMSTNEPMLFSIGTISLSLEILDIITINII
jgi:hypothetical protein